jgi:hypothetical protein
VVIQQSTLQARQGATTPSNKGMKLTSVERIGRSQLIPSVGQTFLWERACQNLRTTGGPSCG